MLFSRGRVQPSVLLIKRAETLSRHRGEWALPGGGAEPSDRSLLDTALRETEEELGVSRADIDVWGPLDAVVTGTGYVVWPFGGLIDERVGIAPSEAEVADVIRMPLSVLVDPAHHRTITRLDNPGGREFGAFSYDGKIIWGATARMLFQVARSLKQAHMAPAAGMAGEDNGSVAGGNGV